MTDALLNFVIPIRHHKNAKDWPRLKRNLVQTAQSIAGQTDPRWQAVLVANHDSELPALPERFRIVRVDFPPNAGLDQANGVIEKLYAAIRSDKGRRILAGLVAVQPRGHVMIVDDDDFVSNRLTSFVAASPQCNGWWIEHGYVWSDNGKVVLRRSDFSRLCGTSHIIRSDLYNVPSKIEDASEDYVNQMLGSHIFIENFLSESGTPLQALPFYGAIYRVGHLGSVTASASLRHTLLSRDALRHPRRTIRLAQCLRWVTPALKDEFFGRLPVTGLGGGE